MKILFADNDEKLRECRVRPLEENYTEAALDCEFIRMQLPGQDCPGPSVGRKENPPARLRLIQVETIPAN